MDGRKGSNTGSIESAGVGEEWWSWGALGLSSWLGDALVLQTMLGGSGRGRGRRRCAQAGGKVWEVCRQRTTMGGSLSANLPCC